MATRTHTNDLLKIDVTESDDHVEVKWSGRSVLRNPGAFVTPILIDAMAEAGKKNKRLLLDFVELEYMNSSTITPIIKILERARRGRNAVTVFYNKALIWQDVSFSALQIFQTRDNRVTIKGAG